MSLTRRVPVAVPSVRQSSVPTCGFDATNTTTPVAGALDGKLRTSCWGFELACGEPTPTVSLTRSGSVTPNVWWMDPTSLVPPQPPPTRDSIATSVPSDEGT